jgi:hypothetical protein
MRRALAEGVSKWRCCCGCAVVVRPSPELEAIARRLARSRVGGGDAFETWFSKSDHLLVVGTDETEWLEGARGSEH